MVSECVCAQSRSRKQTVKERKRERAMDWEATAAATATKTIPAKHSNCTYMCTRNNVGANGKRQEYRQEQARNMNRIHTHKHTRAHTQRIYTRNRSQNENASILNVNRARQCMIHFIRIFFSYQPILVLSLPSLFQFTLFIPCKTRFSIDNNNKRNRQWWYDNNGNGNGNNNTNQSNANFEFSNLEILEVMMMMIMCVWCVRVCTILAYKYTHALTTQTKKRRSFWWRFFSFSSDTIFVCTVHLSSLHVIFVYTLKIYKHSLCTYWWSTH